MVSYDTEALDWTRVVLILIWFVHACKAMNLTVRWI